MIPLRAPIRKSRLVTLPKDKSNCVITDHFALSYKGNLKRATADNFIKSLNEYKDGVIEIMVHPGFPGKGDDSIFNSWWQAELAVLEDLRVHKFLSKLELTNYRDLSRARSNI
jgi:predicted glycoside hydrolase/deacetylase ChbG (UPF0249 family)